MFVALECDLIEKNLFLKVKWEKIKSWKVQDEQQMDVINPTLEAKTHNLMPNDVLKEAYSIHKPPIAPFEYDSCWNAQIVEKNISYICCHGLNFVGLVEQENYYLQ